MWEIAIGWVAVGGLIFGLLMLLGPPKWSHCDDRKPHEFGPWDVCKHNDNFQERRCERCGFIQRADV